MNYKDLNVYQRAYKVAIDLHCFLEKNEGNFTQDEINQLKSMSRSVIGNIAESFSQRSPKAKRFFNFKALDQIHSIQLDLDFLHDIQRFQDETYSKFYEEYDICGKQLYKLNKSILDTQNKSEPVAAARQATPVAA